MFDINKTIMRCLVKNLAMFGLGLYVYSGEDLPEEEKQQQQEEQKKQQQEPTPQLVSHATLRNIEIMANGFAKIKGKEVQEVYNALQERYGYIDIKKLTEKDGQALVNTLANWSRQSKAELSRKRGSRVV